MILDLDPFHPMKISVNLKFISLRISVVIVEPHMHKDFVIATITDKGGWLVMQRRQEKSVDFDRDSVAYEDGFGSRTGKFCYGL